MNCLHLLVKDRRNLHRDIVVLLNLWSILKEEAAQLLINTDLHLHSSLLLLHNLLHHLVRGSNRPVHLLLFHLYLEDLLHLLSLPPHPAWSRKALPLPLLVLLNLCLQLLDAQAPERRLLNLLTHRNHIFLLPSVDRRHWGDTQLHVQGVGARGSQTEGHLLYLIAWYVRGCVVRSAHPSQRITPVKFIPLSKRKQKTKRVFLLSFCFLFFFCFAFLFFLFCIFISSLLSLTPLSSRSSPSSLAPNVQAPESRSSTCGLLLPAGPQCAGEPSSDAG